ncbi:MAG: tetratricopeptide repeat protein [Pyrinomonadaceae bacterium]
MKRCPECRRDYYDDTLLYCLDDGNALLDGPASGRRETRDGSLEHEPQTAILSEPGAVATGFQSEPPASAGGQFAGDESTRQFAQTTDQTAIFPRGAAAEPQDYSKSEPSERQSHSAHRAAEPKPGFGNRLLLATLALVVIALGGFFGYRYFSSGDGGQINSIAVLPFENRSGSSDTEYLSDGLADSLIYRLSQLPNLKVSPTSSVMRYKGLAGDAAKAANELGVDAVMTGRLSQIGDNLNISVQLIDVKAGKVLWAEQYDRKMADLLATQREIATTIAQKLELKLAGTDTTGITKRYTDNNEAYQLYLKGRHAWNKRTGESLKQALDFYNRAIAEDPGFALAYSALAETYVLFANYDVAPAKDSMPQAKAAAMRALELDESLAEAHVAYAAYLALFEYDMARSEAEYRRAIELNPSYATAHQWLGELLVRLKRFDEAMAMIRKAQELDPLSPVISFNIGWQHYQARRYDEAIAEYDATLGKFPDFHLTQWGRCWAFNSKGDLAKAVPVCRRAQELVSDAPNTGYLAMVLARAGQVDEATRLLDQLKKESERRPVPKTAFAYAYIGLNQREEALRMLELEVEDRGYLATDFGVGPEYDEFRSDPRFKALLKKMNLPE